MNVEDYYNELAEKLVYDTEQSLDQALESLVELAKDMHYQLIRDYYKYIPKYYQRHISQEGANLYRSGNIYARNDYIEDDFNNPMSMLDYNYKISASAVLSIIASGTRGVPGYHDESWGGSFSCDYFDFYGDLNEAQEKFEESANDIYVEEWKRNMRARGWDKYF